jgi:multiple sugar transport system substrate-binding protein
MTLRVALVGGPMYDGLYEPLQDRFDLDVAVHADHPTLNRSVARRLSAGDRLDLISTHSKYAPSQEDWLLDLAELLSADDLELLSPAALDLCRFNGRLLSAPRLIDVRVLWVRSDRGDGCPDTWEQLLDSDMVFGFPGRDSGLFGTFFELVVSAGGSLFAADGRTPTIDSEEAVWAATSLQRLAERAPEDLPAWHYDEVDQALLDGRVDAAAAWPSAYDRIRASTLAEVLEPHPYPAGSARRVTYSGCHSWAIPTTCEDPEGAVRVLRALLEADLQSVDGRSGAMPSNRAAMAALEGRGTQDEERLRLTREAIAEQMITYPPLRVFPDIEEVGWRELHEVVRGAKEPAAAVRAIADAAATIVRGNLDRRQPAPRRSSTPGGHHVLGSDDADREQEVGVEGRLRGGDHEAHVPRLGSLVEAITGESLEGLAGEQPGEARPDRRFRLQGVRPGRLDLHECCRFDGQDTNEWFEDVDGGDDTGTDVEVHDRCGSRHRRGDRVVAISDQQPTAMAKSRDVAEQVRVEERGPEQGHPRVGARTS